MNLRSYFPSTTAERLRQNRLATFLGIFIGLVIAIVGFISDQLVRGLSLALYSSVGALLRTQHIWPALILFVLIALFYVLIAIFMVLYIAPLGAGSGIPELKSYLNGVKIPGFLSLRSFFVKTFGVAFSIAGGLLVGKQGPMIHAGAIIGAGISQAASTTFRWRLHTSAFGFLRTDAWKRDFCAVGAGIGVAVAFGAPMGGWMWIYEEACTHWTWTLGFITLGGCLSGAILVRLLNYLAADLPGGGFSNFKITHFGKLFTPSLDSIAFPLKDIPAFALLAVIGGLVGALLPFFSKHITLFRYKHVSKPKRRIFETALLTICTAVLRILIPFLAGDCRNANQNVTEILSTASLDDFSQFNCPNGQFSLWAALIYNPSDSAVRSLLFTSRSVFPAGTIAVSVLYYFVFLTWSYGAAVPAGVFFPAFLLGSAYGRLVGIAVQAIFPERIDVSLPGYAFVGAVSALGGITRTISVAVIALEGTGSRDASFVAVLVAYMAKFVGDLLYKRGIYDLHINLKGIPFLSPEVPFLESYQQLRVSDVMCSNVVGVRRFSKVSELLHMLNTKKHNAFPVFLKVPAPFLEEESKICGNEVWERPKHKDLDDIDADTVDSDSPSSSVQAEFEKRKQMSEEHSYPISSIITPTHCGMEATIFDEGNIRQVRMTTRGEIQAMRPERGNGKSRSYENSQDEDESLAGSDGKMPPALGTRCHSAQYQNSSEFELMGTVERGTLLAMLKYECDKYEKGEICGQGTEEDVVPPEELDAAWPNPARLKGDEESLIFRRINACNLLNISIDLKPYVDPDPLLLSDRALSFAAYDRFRGTGSRHILVVNMRSGRVCGIITRKDVLPESINDVLERLNAVKVE